MSLLFGYDSVEDRVTTLEAGGGGGGGNTGGSSFTKDVSSTKVELTKDLAAGTKVVTVLTPSSDSHASNKKYVDDKVAAATIADSTDSGTTYTLRRDLLSGSRTFRTNAAPLTDDELVNKRYVDENSGGIASVTGVDTADVTHNLDATSVTLSVATPTDDSHAATKKYVDDSIPATPTGWYYFGAAWFLGKTSRVDTWQDMPKDARPPVNWPLPYTDKSKLYVEIFTFANDYDSNEDMEGHGIDFLIWLNYIATDNTTKSVRIYLGSKTLSSINTWTSPGPTGHVYGQSYRRLWEINEKYPLASHLTNYDPRSFLLGYKITSGVLRGNEITITFRVGQDN